jgi:hypothetical protein
VSAAKLQEAFLDERGKRQLAASMITTAQALRLRQRQVEARHLLEFGADSVDERAVRHDEAPGLNPFMVPPFVALEVYYLRAKKAAVRSKLTPK